MSIDLKNVPVYKWELFFDELNNESPRAAVILSGAFLDSMLRDILKAFMIENDKIVDELLGNEKIADTPLSSFGARLKACYCLGFISKNEYDDLNCIRNIRNKFAHSIHGFTFSNPEIIKLCNKLKIPSDIGKILPPDLNSDYQKYIFTVSVLSARLALRFSEARNNRRICKEEIITRKIGE